MDIDGKSESEAGAWPRITVVTPVFNQARYIEQTIRSILDQSYPNLEYIIIDGGSTDGTVDLIRRYADRVAHWVSETDQGMYDAINKGFAGSTGEIMAWLNADDLYLPYTLRTVARVFLDIPSVSWVSTRVPVIVNENGEATEIYRREGYCRTWFRRGWHLDLHPKSKGTIMQEGTFWRRSLWQQTGGRVRSDLAMAGDYELWSRFWNAADLVTLDIPLACFRRHAGQKTVRLAEYVAEATQACPPVIDQPQPRTGWRRLVARGEPATSNAEDGSWVAAYDTRKRVWTMQRVPCPV